MKITAAIATLAAALASLAEAAVPSKRSQSWGFMEACNGEFGPYYDATDNSLRASCPDSSGNFHCSRLPLDNCFGNNNGYLISWQNGDFSLSCPTVPAQGSTDLLNFYVLCYAMNGKQIGTALSLDSFIGKNDDGMTFCLDQAAVSC